MSLMSFENSVIKIRRTYSVISGKDLEVNLRYVGNSHGITKPWQVSIDSYRSDGESLEEAIKKMLNELKKQLETKVKSTQLQFETFQKTLSQFSD